MVGSEHLINIDMGGGGEGGEVRRQKKTRGREIFFLAKFKLTSFVKGYLNTSFIFLMPLSGYP